MKCSQTLQHEKHRLSAISCSVYTCRLFYRLITILVCVCVCAKHSATKVGWSWEQNRFCQIMKLGVICILFASLVWSLVVYHSLLSFCTIFFDFSDFSILISCSLPQLSRKARPTAFMNAPCPRSHMFVMFYMKISRKAEKLLFWNKNFFSKNIL